MTTVKTDGVAQRLLREVHQDPSIPDDERMDEFWERVEALDPTSYVQFQREVYAALKDAGRTSH